MEEILVIKDCWVPRFATEDDKTMFKLPAGAILNIIAKDSPWFITVEGILIPKTKAILIKKPLDTQQVES